MNAVHLHHLIIVGAIILFVTLILVRRLYRAYKRGATRHLSTKQIILLTCLLLYIGVARIVYYPHYALWLTLAWGLPLLLTGYYFYLKAKKIDIQPEASSGKFLVPNRLYITLLFWLIPYALISLTIGLLKPTFINNLYYLVISSIVKGIIAGFYIGYGLGFTLSYRKKPNSTK